MKQKRMGYYNIKISIAPKLVNPTRPDRFITLLKYEEDIKKLNE